MEHLRIASWRLEESPFTSSIQLPFLRELCFSVSRTNFTCFLPTTLPLDQITSLTFEGHTSIAQIAACLIHFPQLRDLRLQFCTGSKGSPQQSEFSSHQQIICPSLVNLDLSSTTEIEFVE